MKKLAKYVCSFGPVYVLDYSGFYDMHIEKWVKKKKKNQKSAKKPVIAVWAGGGWERYGAQN